MEIRQILDTPLKIRRNPAFSQIDLLIQTKDGDVTVTLDVESTIYVLENLDEGPKTFQEIRPTWFPGWRGLFRPRRD